MKHPDAFLDLTRYNVFLYLIRYYVFLDLIRHDVFLDLIRYDAFIDLIMYYTCQVRSGDQDYSCSMLLYHVISTTCSNAGGWGSTAL